VKGDGEFWGHDTKLFFLAPFVLMGMGGSDPDNCLCLKDMCSKMPQLYPLEHTFGGQKVPFKSWGGSGFQLI